MGERGAKMLAVLLLIKVLELAEQPLTVGIRYMSCCPILLKPLLISAYISTSSLSVPKGPRN